MDRRVTKGKGLIRSLSRRATKSRKLRPVEARTGRPVEPAACERCGAIFTRRAWRRGGRVTHALLAGATWVVCPACAQVSDQEYFGRVLVRGAYVAASEAAIRRRIQNVAERARFTQPERRLVSVERDAHGLEVLTTSQKLAHRIVHELRKAFGGRAVYAWSDDGSLLATWRRDDMPAARR